VYHLVEVSQAFQKKHTPFKYLIFDSTPSEKKEGADAIVNNSSERIVLTATTHIPHLDLLGKSNCLIGFPNLDLISSAVIRERIDAGKIMDLGKGPQANLEKIIELQPDWMMVSTMGEDLKHFEVLKKAGIPVLFNGEYMEQHPLGRAEWIKFTGLLLGKFEEASAIFDKIERNYTDAQNLTAKIPSDKRPTVLSGTMYKDIWYAPGNESWGSILLKEAGGKYVFEEEKGTGSVQLSYEHVLSKALDADFWIGAADYSSLRHMSGTDKRYTAFQAIKNKKVYTYTQKKGATGGILYFEEGYVRPDLILLDLVKILHPELAPNHSLYFYTLLNGS
jgi:iron complex transport system substrate-binding protein